MQAVHFGAGNIGRGFIGALLRQSGYEVTFVDVNEDLINAINRENQYTVVLAGSGEKQLIEGVKGLNSLTQAQEVIEAIADADFVTTAVGPTVLKIISKIIARGLNARSEGGGAVPVIACENMIGGSTILGEYVKAHLPEKDVAAMAKFPDAAVDRIVPNQLEQETLNVTVEPYFEWLVESSGLGEEKPEVSGLRYVTELKPYIERKLFTVNTGHAAGAYLGAAKGYDTIQEALADDSIREKVASVLKETGRVLVQDYQFDEKTHEEYRKTTIARFTNPALSDEVTRVGRGPIRKLGRQDRLVAPALRYEEITGVAPETLAETIAAALNYKNDEDQEAVLLQEKVKAKGAIAALVEVAELDENSMLAAAVKKYL